MASSSWKYRVGVNPELALDEVTDVAPLLVAAGERQDRAVLLVQAQV